MFGILKATKNSNGPKPSMAVDSIAGKSNFQIDSEFKGNSLSIIICLFNGKVWIRKNHRIRCECKSGKCLLGTNTSSNSTSSSTI